MAYLKKETILIDLLHALSMCTYTKISMAASDKGIKACRTTRFESSTAG